MKNIPVKATSYLFPPIFVLLLLIMMQSCQKSIDRETETPVIAGKDPKNLKDFVQVNLVGNNDEYDPNRIDPILVNAWGIAISPGGTIWVSAEATGFSTVYNKDGNDVIPPVTIPSHTASTGGHPTGQVFNSGGGFRLPTNGNPARFIFAGADGVISAWNGGGAAVKIIDDFPDVYLGIAIANNGPDKYLYVASFSEGEIEVYDTAWEEVSMSFEDPNMPEDYSPFNIQEIDGKLYVMYAKLGAGGEEVPGPGNGYVNVFNPDGTLMKRLITRGQLNAPWGVAKAPASFWGPEGMPGMILVGNFGDGRINVYDANGNFFGQLRSAGNPIVIEGLWGISFAPAAATAINPNWLFFAAGPDEEEEGLFGYITK